MRHVLVGIGAVILAVGVWLARPWLFPDDEAKIRAVLERIEENVSAARADGDLGTVGRAAALRRELDPQVTIDPGAPYFRVVGRNRVVATAARLTNSVPDFKLRFVDVQVTVDPDRTSASAYLTAEAHFRQSGGSPAYEALELDVAFRQVEGEWVVASVAPVPTLQPVSPQ